MAMPNEEALKRELDKMQQIQKQAQAQYPPPLGGAFSSGLVGGHQVGETDCATAEPYPTMELLRQIRDSLYFGREQRDYWLREVDRLSELEQLLVTNPATERIVELLGQAQPPQSR